VITAEKEKRIEREKKEGKKGGGNERTSRAT